jgi:hypothetical protein
MDAAFLAELEAARRLFAETGSIPGARPDECAGIRAAGERLGRDMLTTTSHRLELVPFREDEETVVTLWFDGEFQGLFEYCYYDEAGMGVESAVVRVADRAREHSLDELIWGGWPMCPRSGHGHALNPVISAGRAAWQCGPDGTVVAAIGDLPGAG